MSAFQTAVVTAQQMRVVYGSALRQFEALWPAYLAKAEAKDRPVREQYESKKASLLKREKERRAAYDEEMRKYEKDFEAWENKSKEQKRTFFGWLFVKVPPRPSYPDPYPSFPYELEKLGVYSIKIDEQAFLANDLRSEVKDAAALAFSGPSEFHLTQDQLQRMKDWESGVVLDQVRKYISDEEEIPA